MIQPKYFYGWVVVGCAFAILCVAYGMQFTYGVFMPFIDRHGWDRGSLSLPYSLYVFIYSALGLVTGRLTDRLGQRIGRRRRVFAWSRRYSDESGSCDMATLYCAQSDCRFRDECSLRSM